MVLWLARSYRFKYFSGELTVLKIVRQLIKRSVVPFGNDRLLNTYLEQKYHHPIPGSLLLFFCNLKEEQSQPMRQFKEQEGFAFKPRRGAMKRRVHQVKLLSCSINLVNRLLVYERLLKSMCGLSQEEGCWSVLGLKFLGPL